MATPMGDYPRLTYRVLWLLFRYSGVLALSIPGYGQPSLHAQSCAWRAVAHWRPEVGPSHAHGSVQPYIPIPPYNEGKRQPRAGISTQSTDRRNEGRYLSLTKGAISEGMPLTSFGLRSLSPISPCRLAHPCRAEHSTAHTFVGAQPACHWGRCWSTQSRLVDPARSRAIHPHCGRSSMIHVDPA